MSYVHTGNAVNADLSVHPAVDSCADQLLGCVTTVDRISGYNVFGALFSNKLSTSVIDYHVNLYRYDSNIFIFLL